MNPGMDELLFHTPLFELHQTLRDVTVYEVEGERWVALSGREGRVPENEAARHYGHIDSDNGAQSDAFWDPTWFDFARHWRIYAPDYAVALIDENASSAEWMAVGYQQMELYLDAEDPTKLQGELRRTICRDFCKASIALKTLQPHDLLTLLEVTDGYRVTQLLRLRGAENIRAGLAVARSKMLDLISAISYSMARSSAEQKAYVKALLGEEWQRWRMDDAPKIGFLLDLHDPRSLRLPILDYLQHGVPIYYPFDERYRPRLPLERRISGGISISAGNFAELIDATIRKEDDELPASPLPWDEAAAAEPADDVWMEPAVGETETVHTNDLAEEGARLLKAAWRFDNAPAYPLLGHAWSDGILRKGIIVLGTLEEVKLRLWARRYRVTDAAEVLTEALQRGMRFHYVLPYASIPRFNSLLRLYAPTESSEIDTMDTANFVLDQQPDPVRGWQEYVASVRTLLSQSKGAAFLLEGGIAWRLAIQFGPTDIIRQLANAPTRAVLQHYDGNTDIRGYIGDQVSEREMDILVGLTRNVNGGTTRRWWPTNDDFKYNDFNVGEWTPYHESWFQSWLAIFMSGTSSYAGPHNRHFWNRNLQQHGIRMRQADGEYYEPEDIMDVKERLDNEDGGQWNGARLVDLFDEA